jgi:hypothetical protein
MHHLPRKAWAMVSGIWWRLEMNTLAAHNTERNLLSFFLKRVNGVRIRLHYGRHLT